MITRVVLTLLCLSTLGPAQDRRGPDQAPAEGAAIPDVSAATPDGTTTVRLAEPKRLTVLIFGSHT